jgi:DNA topoisomerase-2
MDEEGEGEDADEDEDGLDEEEREQELDEMVQQAATPTESPNGGCVGRVYRRLTTLEHILLRPDTYIGSPQMSHAQRMWVYDEGVGMNQREISFVPGLYKIFDELLVDAADNYATMTRLDVTIDVDTNTITICNNGAGSTPFLNSPC